MLTDTKAGYGAISIVLHWLAAAAMIYLYLNAPDDHGGRLQVSAASHIALGTGFGLLLLARIFWRLASTNPAPLSHNAGLNTVASIVKMLLLVDILVILATGMLGVWFKGEPVTVFGLWTLPNPVGVNATLMGPMRGLHSLSTNVVFLGLLGLHVLGALKHIVWDRDGTFSRMVWPKGERA
jgi:cytochrome b561